MDWNILESRWKEVGGKKDRLVGKMQQKYGYVADEWAKQQDAKP